MPAKSAVCKERDGRAAEGCNRVTDAHLPHSRFLQVHQPVKEHESYGGYADAVLQPPGQSQPGCRKGRLLLTQPRYARYEHHQIEYVTPCLHQHWLIMVLPSVQKRQIEQA